MIMVSSHAGNSKYGCETLSDKFTRGWVYNIYLIRIIFTQQFYKYKHICYQNSIIIRLTRKTFQLESFANFLYSPEFSRLVQSFRDCDYVIIKI